MPTQQTVIPFAPASTSVNAGQLDRAGQTILQLLNKAAGVAEENSRNAIELSAGVFASAARGRGSDCGARGAGGGLSGASRARRTMVAPRLHRDRGTLFASRPNRATRRASATISPLYGAFLVKKFKQGGASFFHRQFLCRSEKSVWPSQQLYDAPPFSGHTLTASSTMARLVRSG